MGSVVVLPQRLIWLDKAVARVPTLTPRELQLLELLGSGVDTTRALAKAMQISQRTVARHLTAVLEKLGVTSRTRAALVGLRLELRSGP